MWFRCSLYFKVAIRFESYQPSYKTSYAGHTNTSPLYPQNFFQALFEIVFNGHLISVFVAAKLILKLASSSFFYCVAPENIHTPTHLSGNSLKKLWLLNLPQEFSEIY